MISQRKSKLALNIDDENSNYVEQEANSLAGLYTHQETIITTMFNFFLTLISSAIGGIVVLLQINNKAISNFLLLLIGIILAFLLLLGIGFLNAVLNKSAELGQTIISINAIKQISVRENPKLSPYVNYIFNPFVKSVRLDVSKGVFWRIGQHIIGALISDSHLLFIGIINSLIAGCLTFLIAFAYFMASWPGNFIIGLAISILAYLIQAEFAYKELKRRIQIRYLRTSDYKDPPDKLDL